MIIKNPLNKMITVGISGKEYSIDPNGTRDLPDEVAISWKKVHEFLQIINEEVEVKKEIEKDEIKEKIEIDKEETKEETKEEKPKTIRKKGTNK